MINERISALRNLMEQNKINAYVIPVSYTHLDVYKRHVYSMLDIPKELYTPIFAIARIVGWSAHRIEEIINADKIMRPAYVSNCAFNDYIEVEDS